MPPNIEALLRAEAAVGRAYSDWLAHGSTRGKGRRELTAALLELDNVKRQQGIETK